MIRITLFLSFFSLSIGLLSAQTLKGKVTDNEGNPIPNATVYFRETAQGIMIDDRGEFQTTLKEGNYTCEFSSLGYERKTLPIVIDKPIVSISIELDKKTYALKEVIISSKREDPAYAIMRQAIAMAPFYLHQVNTYEAEVYMKGTVKVDHIPRLLKARINNKELQNITDKLFLLESQNEIKFKAPNNYEERILAFSTTLPFDMEASNPMDIMTTSIYDPNMWGRISPLSPGAFSYYKFSLEGMTGEGSHIVNKIKVEPRKKNSKLVSGWLYIIENSWNVQSADLSGTELGVTVRFIANYNEVRPLAFLPTAYDISMNVNTMGVKANGKYNASIQYQNVVLNESQSYTRNKQKTPKPVITTRQPTKKQQKAQQKLETIQEKEELSNRDAYKMSKLMREVVEPEEVKEKRESLELLFSDANIKVTVDSLAKSRDSLYWAEIRDLPLRQEEVVSYQQKDSLELSLKEESNEITLFTPGSKVGKIFFGDKIRFKEKYWVRFNGITGTVPEYNFVDGVWLGQRLSLGTDFSEKRSLSVSPSVYYVTAREAVNWQIDGTFTYAPFKNGKLTLSGGNTTADYNNHTGTLRIINSLSSLFFAENPIKFYQKRFFDASHKIDIANGLILTTGFTNEKRNALKNNLSYSFFGGKPSPNIPTGHLLIMPDNKATQAKVQLDYTPRHHYWVSRRGRKIYAHSLYPTLSLYYEKGISTNKTNSASYDRLELTVKQSIKLNMFDYINYYVNTGKFLSSDRVYFPDFKHFSMADLFITAGSQEHTFNLLDNYSYSSNKQWLQAHISYTSAYLFIKNLSFLQNYLFNESLHARTLWVPGRNYTEFGYSIGFEQVINAGVYIGLEQGKYDTIGFTISIPLLKTLGIK